MQDTPAAAATAASNTVIDVTRLAGRLLKRRLPTGIDRVCLAYVKRYADQARAALHRGPFDVILAPAASRELFGMLLKPPQDLLRRITALVATGTARAWRAPDCAGSVLLNVGHSGPEHLRYADWHRRKGLRPVFMVHDVIPVTHPEYCRAREQERHTRRLDNMLGTAVAVMTNSQATLRALCEYAATRGLRMPPATWAPLAPTTFSAGSEMRPLAEPYFVMLSTIEPRKNHSMILQVWRRLVEQHGMRAPRLVIIGQRGWECENTIDLLERCDSLRGFVVEKPVCCDAELATYLRHAQALLFPSFVEGYGLPLVEALSLGVPAIASDLPVFREIADDVPEYLDPLDAIGWLRCIESFCQHDSILRTSQILRMSKFVAPTWSRHFEILEQLLSQVH
jgi:glycosyltransferase involved in cell wall biosynthesis